MLFQAGETNVSGPCRILCARRSTVYLKWMCSLNTCAVEWDRYPLFAIPTYRVKTLALPGSRLLVGSLKFYISSSYFGPALRLTFTRERARKERIFERIVRAKLYKILCFS